MPVPDEETRLEIFRVHTREKPLASEVDLKALASATRDLVGSDIESICRKASMLAIREFIESQKGEGDNYSGFKISARHLEETLKEVVKGVKCGDKKFCGILI